MIDSWNVFNKLVYVGVLSYDTTNGEFSFVQGSYNSEAHNAVTWLNLSGSSDRIKETILSCRIFPPGRMDASELLRSIGLKEYDAWEIVKATHLINICDCVWMTKGTDPYEFFELHPAANWLVEHGKLAREVSEFTANQDIPCLV